MLKERIKYNIQHLSPVYFAVPMSTGIIAIACHLLGFALISDCLFVLNIAEVLILCTLLGSRLILYFPDFKNDLKNPALGAAFLTTVAAFCIYGTKNTLLKDNFNWALLGWSWAFLLWVLLTFSFLINVITRASKPGLVKALNGSWLLMVVSTQALSISGSIVAGHFELPNQPVFFVSMSFYFLGLILYILIISFIFFRMVFIPLRPQDFHPSYWINMGAAAISTLAGVMMIQQIQAMPEHLRFLPVFETLTVLSWIIGVFWIPVIVYLEIWKRRKTKVKYVPNQWSIVFPLGMFTVCTFKMAEQMELSFLISLPSYTIYIAFFAWLITYWQMLKRVYQRMTEPVVYP